MQKSYKAMVIELVVALGFLALLCFVVLSIVANNNPAFSALRHFTLGGVGLIAIISFVELYCEYRSKVKIMESTTPIRCTIEDFIIARHGKGYSVYPVLRDKQNKLYCVLREDNLSVYTANISYYGYGNIDVEIARNDKSKVSVGSPIDLYVTEMADNVDVKIKDAERYSLNGQSHSFWNINKNNGITILNRLSFAKGIVSVEV